MAHASRNADDVKTFLKSWEKYDSQQTIDFYDRWAQTYEQDSEIIKYRCPNMVVDFLHANYPGGRGDAQVLDVACGSGLVARLMSEVGFRNFVGVDGSKGMLALAEKTGLYQDLRLALLGTEPLPADTGMFDVVVIAGALRHEHAPVSIIRELCHAATPGGYVCMSRVDLSSEVGRTYRQRMEQELQQMEDQGLWRHVASAEMKDYMMDISELDSDQYLTGTMHLYQKAARLH
ncbi:methyltransferase-like protein 27 [Cheilinus undulatus]|uniref:methyltransferase-like protein 27 n=1 Tax=Cheilinus undulatus TaxID=241271 RepID=UPI001BD42B15|nr:methyltransferase-like protein 27 [Cheilinus undulatus]